MALISNTDFMFLFTPEERAHFELLANGNDMVAGHVKAFMHIVDLTDQIHTEHPMISQGLDFFVNIGQMSPERRDELMAIVAGIQ